MKRTTILFTVMLTLMVTIGQTTYAQSSLMDNIKAMFGGGEKKSKGNIATPHAEVFTDDYGISGLYHLWKPWDFPYTTSWGEKEKTAYTMNLDYNGKAHTNFYLGVEDENDLGMPRPDWTKPLWDTHKIYYAKFGDIDFFSLEDGIIILADMTKCDESPFYKVDDDATVNIMAKDPEKLKDLTLEIVKEMAVKRYVEIYQLYDDIYAEKNKLPKKGTEDSDLNADAMKFMLEAASIDDAGDWSSQFIYAYPSSSDWYITYETSAKITPKNKRLTVIGVGHSATQEGKCFYQVGYLQKNYNGSTYGEPYFSGFGGGKTPTTMENAMIYKK